MRTRVFITVDVECAEERPRGNGWSTPLTDELRIWGRFVNQTRELGIPLIMEELERTGHRGTFFVEPLSSHWIGIDRLAGVCDAIRERGHDLQLHLHPVLRRPRWESHGVPAPADDIGDYELGEQIALLTEGIELFEAAGVPRAEIVGFRAGNFGADNRTWSALAACGLRVSSNYNASALRDGCRIDWPRQELELFDTGTGVFELPISTFGESGTVPRPLQLTAVSTSEMFHFLCTARQLGIRDVTVVTHPFELFHVDSAAGRRGRPNRVNISRLRGLCQFLERRDEEFEVCTIGGIVRDGRLEAEQLPVPTAPVGRRLLKLRRLAEQVIKRIDARLGS